MVMSLYFALSGESEIISKVQVMLHVEDLLDVGVYPNIFAFATTLSRSRAVSKNISFDIIFK